MTLSMMLSWITMKTQDKAHIILLSGIMLTTKDILVNSILQKNTILVALVWRHDTQHDNTRPNGIQHNNNGTKTQAQILMLSVIMLTSKRWQHRCWWYYDSTPNYCHNDMICFGEFHSTQKYYFCWRSLVLWQSVWRHPA